MPLIDLDPQDSDEAEPTPRPTEPLFRYKGKVYEVPVDFTPNESLAALEIASTSGYAASLVFLMKKALGEDGWKALLSATEMKPDQYQQIAKVIQDKALSSAKAMTGN